MKIEVEVGQFPKNQFPIGIHLASGGKDKEYPVSMAGEFITFGIKGTTYRVSLREMLEKIVDLVEKEDRTT